MAQQPQLLASAPVTARAPILGTIGILILMLAFTLIIRLPFFFPAVISWDESTYILIGQSLVNGHLPYLQTWDIKPPLAFAPYALAIAIFGKHLPGVRLAGALCVAFSAFFVYLTAARLWNRATGFAAAVFCIVAISLLQAGQATVTEHVMLPPLLASMYLLTCRKQSIGLLAVVGALMSAATLIRLNMAFAAMAVGAYLLTDREQPSRNIARMTAYLMGGIIVVLTVCLP